MSPSVFYSYIIEQQSCFLTLTEVDFSKKIAFAFLKDLAQVGIGTLSRETGNSF